MGLTTLDHLDEARKHLMAAMELHDGADELDEVAVDILEAADAVDEARRRLAREPERAGETA